MNAFVEMRKFVASNAVMFERISNIELKQPEYQREADKKFDEPNAVTVAAIEEGRKLVKDKTVKGYKNMASLKSALEE